MDVGKLLERGVWDAVGAVVVFITGVANTGVVGSDVFSITDSVSWYALFLNRNFWDDKISSEQY